MTKNSIFSIFVMTNRFVMTKVAKSVMTKLICNDKNDQ